MVYPVIVPLRQIDSLFRTAARHLERHGSTIVPQWLAEIDGVESAEERDRHRASNARSPTPLSCSGRLDMNIKIERPRRRQRENKSSRIKSRHHLPLGRSQLMRGRSTRILRSVEIDEAVDSMYSVVDENKFLEDHVPQRATRNALLQELLVGPHRSRTSAAARRSCRFTRTSSAATADRNERPIDAIRLEFREH